MSDHVVLLSVPGLRGQDLAAMPNLSRLVSAGDRATLVPSFPAVTWPVQANMLTGKLPAEHGVIANGFFWRDTHQVEMWTAWNDPRPRISGSLAWNSSALAPKVSAWALASAAPSPRRQLSWRGSHTKISCPLRAKAAMRRRLESSLRFRLANGSITKR